ncbi:helix-turn-helix domain-containing protein [Micromonospora sp. NPDC050417]|uniref:helix-turn-helix domain-containing protein n=1 Tax=Micromonospora sp. NPDC050417 TaxID=3364280 RepID=UPI0037B72970
MSTACTAQKHGTRNAYERYRCRCPEARQVMRPVWRRRPSRAIQADPVAVDLLRTGRRPAIVHRSEQAAAIRALHDQGLPASQIAGRIGVTVRTVERHRATYRAVTQ